MQKPSSILLLTLLLCTGCATPNHMALTKDIPKLDLSKGSIAVFTLSLTNEYKQDYPPKPLQILVRSLPDRGGKNHDRAMGAQWNELTNQANVYIVSLQLPPGEYLLKDIRGVSEKPMGWVSGKFKIPLGVKGKLDLGEIVYWGRVSAVNRKRENDVEPRSGGIFPLVDQSVTGYSGGTFKVDITDRYDEDLPLLRRIFPVLDGAKVEKNILPQWEMPSQ